jgi:hypothetical protein
VVFDFEECDVDLDGTEVAYLIDALVSKRELAAKSGSRACYEPWMPPASPHP